MGTKYLDSITEYSEVGGDKKYLDQTANWSKPEAPRESWEDEFEGDINDDLIPYDIVPDDTIFYTDDLNFKSFGNDTPLSYFNKFYELENDPGHDDSFADEGSSGEYKTELVLPISQNKTKDLFYYSGSEYLSFIVHNQKLITGTTDFSGKYQPTISMGYYDDSKVFHEVDFSELTYNATGSNYCDFIPATTIESWMKNHPLNYTKMIARGYKSQKDGTIILSIRINISTRGIDPNVRPVISIESKGIFFTSITSTVSIFNSQPTTSAKFVKVIAGRPSGNGSSQTNSFNNAKYFYTVNADNVGRAISLPSTCSFFYYQQSGLVSAGFESSNFKFGNYFAKLVINSSSATSMISPLGNRRFISMNLNVPNVVSFSQAFNGCNNLVNLNIINDKYVNINHSTTTSGTFSNCYKLKSMKLKVSTMPGSRTGDMFPSCYSLRTIDIEFKNSPSSDSLPIQGIGTKLYNLEYLKLSCYANTGTFYPLYSDGSVSASSLDVFMPNLKYLILDFPNMTFNYSTTKPILNSSSLRYLEINAKEVNLGTRYLGDLPSLEELKINATLTMSSVDIIVYAAKSLRKMYIKKYNCDWIELADIHGPSPEFGSQGGIIIDDPSSIEQIASMHYLPYSDLSFTNTWSLKYKPTYLDWKQIKVLPSWWDEV